MSMTNIAGLTKTHAPSTASDFGHQLMMNQVHKECPTIMS